MPLIVPLCAKWLPKVKTGRQWLPLRDSKVGHHFDDILKIIGYQGKGYSFHSFRHSGASLALNNIVKIQEIQNHGTWTSDCV